MKKHNLYPADKFPPTNILAAAIKRLPKPGPTVLPQTVIIDAGPAGGKFSVAFVVRSNSAGGTTTWFWGVENSERIEEGQAGLADPD